MAQSGVPTVETQKTIIARLLETPKIVGDSWFLVDAQWFKQWKRYVGQYPWDSQKAGDSKFHPGRIDNSALLQEDTEKESTSSTQLRRLSSDLYVLLPSEAWTRMVAWYGLVQNQEPIERYVIQPIERYEMRPIKRYVNQTNPGGQCEVEIYLQDLQLCELSDTKYAITRQFSRQCTQEQLEKEMRRLFGIQDETEVRLFEYAKKELGKQITFTTLDELDYRILNNRIALQQTKNASSTLMQVKRKATQLKENVDWECPICHEEMVVAKTLPCTHLACAHCVLSWLQKGGRRRGCPLCRAPILTPTSSSLRDLAALVDDLPTDLSPLVQVELDPALKGPHVCGMCPSNVMARSYCFQCGIKLCTACTTYHRKLPVSKDHPLVYLIYTKKQLASPPAPKCHSHRDKLAERYCSTHKQLICVLCSTSIHSSCEQVKALADLIQEKKDQLKQRAQRVKTEALDLNKQINAVKDGRRKIKGVFDDLQKRVEKRRQEMIALVLHHKDKMTLTRAPSFLFHSGVVNSLLTSPLDVTALLKLGSAASAVEERAFSPDGVKYGPTDVLFDAHSMTELHQAIASLGVVEHQTVSETPSTASTTTSSTVTSSPTTSSMVSSSPTTSAMTSPSTGRQDAEGGELVNTEEGACLVISEASKNPDSP